MKKILIGGIIQESNTFSPVMSTMRDFRSNLFLEEEEVLKQNTKNEILGFIEGAREDGLEVQPTIFAHAISSGMFTADAYKELQTWFITKVKSFHDYEGIYLALHGAMVAENCEDVEGDLLEQVRRHVGEKFPIVISLDLHANVTGKMARLVNGIIGFRTYPHTDFFSTGYRSAKYFSSLLKKEIVPVIEFRKLPMIIPAEKSQSSHGPFADLLEEAVIGEKRGDSIVTSLFPVQPWLDIKEMGASVVVVGENREKASAEADRLAELFWNKRNEFVVELSQLDKIVAKLRAEAIRKTPFVVSDSADSPGAGATGDSNIVLKELLRLKADEDLHVLLTIVDAAAVDQAIHTGLGKKVTLSLGYSLNLNKSYGSPIKVTGTVKRIGDGRFFLSGGYAENTEAFMGRCAVLQIGTISILITEQPTFSGDPAMYRSMGMEPSEADLVVVKSANQFRAEYEKLSKQIFILDTPGCSPADITSLHYKNIDFPCYPFQDHFEWRRKLYEV
ncbi:M81 family metallopeptidase [Fictibacillus terranigra]|uniref:M81 family metallopeptidase n=1 Tax=Fictibacillus terranigra TaxID=3058424 RepID=A0ABT8EDN5_9BACL|nr:M81 family metallopeptidase [Fictibacillus sp. CENA-BCM004]MDN4075996.1 M81 family metallopeptidase [Fictibacillus sp. CENA-BCM004]